jgi:molybdopterin-dependent oxidoreductase alpha subunit
VRIGSWDTASWVSLRPNGIGLRKPKHYREMVAVAIENRRHPRYAWRILRDGVCDGCALGVAGFRDWTIDGVHLCTTRLKLLALNTADAMDHSVLADVARLESLDGAALRGLGRLGHPMRRRAGEPGFTRIGWDEAIDALAGGFARAGGSRCAVYLTSRGITNEVYYVAGKAARAMGVASVDSAARVCHAPSTLGLKATIGWAATTCSFQDVLETDLVVLIGSNPANNQPVFMKYLHLAKRNGARVAVVNPYLEPGLDRYWVPSAVESALFGTRIADLHVPVRPGGDVAFCNAVLRVLLDRGEVDEAFIGEHTDGWPALRAHLRALDVPATCAAAGLGEEQVRAFADLYASSRTAILVWSMGITQHRGSVDSVRAIVNLALARGNVGRDGAGLMPIRGHSGVQGGAEMGAYATALPGGLPVDEAHAADLARAWGFAVPAEPGLTAPEMVEAAERGDLDVLWSSGGNLLDVLPDPRRVAAGLGAVPLRAHSDVVVTSQMLVPPPPGGEVLLLPVATRYEQEGGGTETTTERRIVFSPEIPGHRVGEAMSEWRLFAEVAARARPDLRAQLSWPSNRALREEIARVVPLYAGIETLERTGDAVQYGGRHHWGGHGRFTVLDNPSTEIPEGRFVVSTRRGKQFNSLIYAAADPLSGAERDDVLMDPDDAERLGLRAGDRVVLRSSTGSMDARVRLARLPARTVQVHWPEGNVLIPSGPDHREPSSQVPDYNALVEVVRVPGG